MEPKAGAKPAEREPPGRKSGSEAIPEPAQGPVDPRETPRRDSRREEPAPEPGRGIPERKGGKR